MTTFKDLAFADFDMEVAATRRVLARLPDAEFGWKPHEKSTTLGELGAHIVNTFSWQTIVLTTDGIDFAASPPPRIEAASSQALVAAFDAKVPEVRAALDAADEAALGRDFTLRMGERVIFTRPRAVAFRSFGLSHVAHHRAQLTVYLRLLGLPVPPVYGPTADER